MFESCTVRSALGNESLSCCVNCKRAECPNAKDEQHFFDGDRVCRHCHVEQCPYFSQSGVSVSFGVHKFIDGRCVFCQHYECVQGRTHRRSESNYCEICGKTMCDDFTVHDIDSTTSYCKRCLTYFGETDRESLCGGGHVHAHVEGKTACSICGCHTCLGSDGHLSCKGGSDNSKCVKCSCYLCDISGQPHSFVKKEIRGDDGFVYEVYVCSQCNEYRCSKSSSGDDKYDIHKFDGEEVCCYCGQSRCPRSGDTHRVRDTVIGGENMNLCIDCGQIMCASRGSGKSHLCEGGECKFCHYEQCEKGNVHIFHGPDGKCIFCPRTRCGSLKKCHNPVSGSRGLECEHCHCRICPEAYFSHDRKLTICQDDGQGFCRYCHRGVCTYRNSSGCIVSGDHDFDEQGVCRQCDSSKCGELKDKGYSHKNERGYCLCCGKQLCTGNREHIFRNSEHGTRLCIVCGGEECEKRGGSVHSLGPDGCCLFCCCELCTNGKRRHCIQDVVINDRVKVRCCILCNREVCKKSVVRDQCHVLDSVGKCCVKCRSILCVRKDCDYLTTHYFSDGNQCHLCSGERCGQRNDVHHRNGSGFCVKCGQEMCKGNRRHVRGENNLCKLCEQELCEKGDGCCHRFNRDGHCLLCHGYRCDSHGRVHIFEPADYNRGDSFCV